jgi:UDP-N-acetylmuramoylalanine-D-glutamate ligase
MIKTHNVELISLVSIMIAFVSNILKNHLSYHMKQNNYILLKFLKKSLYFIISNIKNLFIIL